MVNTGFAPIVGPDAKVLILGSMPGVKSLQDQQYYAHPRNAFWWIMGQLFAAGPDKPYAQRQQILIEQRVAVWDVLRSCKREGSLDSAIQVDGLVVNDFAGFFSANPKVDLILFNGKTAATLFQRHVVKPGLCQQLPSTLSTLPSTSPANAGMSKEQKLSQWREKLQLRVKAG